MNDLFSQVIKESDPGIVKRTDPLSARGLSELAQYQALEGDRLKERRGAKASRLQVPAWFNPRLAAACTLVLAVVVSTLAFNGVTSPGAAHAATPPLLEITPVAQGAPELLRQMEEKIRQNPTNPKIIRSQTWVFATNIGENGEIESTVVEPRWSETIFETDGSVHYLVIAAPPFPGQEDTSLPDPGTILEDETFPPGAWEFDPSDGPPANPDEIGDYMADFIGITDPTTADVFRELATLLSHYPLSSEQEAALLYYLSTLSDVEVIGSTTDRLGREAIVFRPAITQGENFEERLLLSPETGKIIAAETIRKDDPEFDGGVPRVVHYAAWQR